jgi:hypothetical protein
VNHAKARNWTETARAFEAWGEVLATRWPERASVERTLRLIAVAWCGALAALLEEP